MTVGPNLEGVLAEVESAAADGTVVPPNSYGARLRRHYDQWRIVQAGQLIDLDVDGSSSPSTLDILAVLRGAIFEEDGADGLLLLPPDLRAQRIEALAKAHGTDAHDFLDILRWWRDCGRKVRR